MPEVIFSGPSGRLEGRYTPSTNPNAPIALIMHPHPQHGGTMNNKVVYLLHKSFKENGFATLRFNFRGVGRSQGEYDEGKGELADATAALEWLQTVHKNASQIWVGGFSFGSWISMQLLMRRPEISGFVSISPPANKYDFSFLAPCPCGGLIIQGNQDRIVRQDSVDELAYIVKEQRGEDAIDYRVIDGGDHFFRGMEDTLQENLTEYIRLTQEYRMVAE